MSETVIHRESKHWEGERRSVAMRPIRGYLSAVLRNGARGLENDASSSYRSDEKRQELAKLSLIFSDLATRLATSQSEMEASDQISLESLSRELQEYRDRAPELKDLLDRLLSDLDILQLVEGEGLAGVNKKLGRLLRSLKNREWREPSASREAYQTDLYEFNDLLCRAIYLFPHLAKNVTVTLISGAAAGAKAAIDQFGYDYYLGDLDNLLKSAGQEDDGAVLRFALPYFFTTGTHGSGERAAQSASDETIYTHLISPRENRRQSVPALAMALRRPLLSYDYCSLPLGLIENVNLADEGALTPFVDTRQVTDWGADGDTPLYALQPRADSLQHYLRFRDFSSYRAFRRKHDLTKYGLTDDIRTQVEAELLEPRAFTNLWEEKYLSAISHVFTGHNKRLTLGYLGGRTNDGELSVYEISDIILPVGGTDHEDQAILMGRILENNRGLRGKYRELLGDDIYTTLMQRPPQHWF